ncbi:MAG TPA: serine hydrolase [Sphingomicrobium sp.]|nr:serine hydrolase [Sphingomicrobium sp.]
MRTAFIALSLALAGCATVPARPSARAEAGIAFDANGELRSYADGLADRLARRPITIDDPARVASVTKLVVAIGVMKLVEAGKLNLDRDVSDYLGWRLRNPAFPDEPISLRQLLSHTSSVREHDDNYVLPLGASLQTAMQDPGEWDRLHGPAAYYLAYTNMNFPIVASVVERVTGERFDIWMRRNVLDPMKIDACFNWATCSDATLARAVELDAPDGKPLKDDLHAERPACPVAIKDGDACDLTRWKPGENGALFSPQGGLRISVRGLSRIGRMLLGQGTLDGVRILSPQSVNTMLTPVWRYDGRNGARDGESTTICAYGLSAQTIPNHRPGCPDDPGTKGATLVGHAGDAYGLRSGIWIDRARGVGIAYFVTAVPDDPVEATAFAPAEAAAFRRSYALLPR